RDLTLTPTNENTAHDERDNHHLSGRKDVNSNVNSTNNEVSVRDKVGAIEEKERIISQGKSENERDVTQPSKSHVQIIHLPSSSADDTPPPIPPPSRQMHTQHTPRIEGVIRIVREDEVSPQLIPPSMVKVSSVETVFVPH